MKIRVLRGDALEVFAIVDLTLIARTEDQPDVAPVEIMRGRGAVLGKERFHESAHGSDSGAGGDHQRITQRIAQHKVSVRAVEVDSASMFHVAEVVGKESAFHAIETEVKAIIAARAAGQRISAGHR